MSVNTTKHIKTISPYKIGDTAYFGMTRVTITSGLKGNNGKYPFHYVTAHHPNGDSECGIVCARLKKEPDPNAGKWLEEGLGKMIAEYKLLIPFFSSCRKMKKFVNMNGTRQDKINYLISQGIPTQIIDEVEKLQMSLA